MQRNLDIQRLAGETPKFRGAWSPSLPDPSVRSFIPVQSLYEVKKLPPRVRENPKPVEVPKELEEIKPPADVLLNILDRNRDLRSYILKDGTCKDKFGRIIGYINIEEGQVGSPKEEYWGCIDEGDFILDKDDQKIGELNTGTAFIADRHGVTIAEFDNAGECKGHDCTFIGQFVGFTYHDMKTVALYLLIVDPNMYNTKENV